MGIPPLAACTAPILHNAASLIRAGHEPVERTAGGGGEVLEDVVEAEDVEVITAAGTGMVRIVTVVGATVTASAACSTAA
jgi:hypothetical protein